MNSTLTKISAIKVNPNNPRLIKDDKFEKLVQSIKDFPEMLEIRPIVVNKDMTILGGNMRYKACIESGIKEVPVIIANNLTEEQQKEFLIKDNVSGGEWDWEVLTNEWNSEELEAWGLDVPVFDNENDNNENDLSNDLETNFRIEIILSDEKTQELLYNELISRNYECRLLTL
jgi:ParB-like chromosome segregation protein Spo0J